MKIIIEKLNYLKKIGYGPVPLFMFLMYQDDKLWAQKHGNLENLWKWASDDKRCIEENTTCWAKYSKWGDKKLKHMTKVVFSIL